MRPLFARAAQKPNDQDVGGGGRCCKFTPPLDIPLVSDQAISDRVSMCSTRAIMATTGDPLWPPGGASMCRQGARWAPGVQPRYHLSSLIPPVGGAPLTALFEVGVGLKAKRLKVNRNTPRNVAQMANGATRTSRGLMA